jgi:hypothetical protein
MMMMMMMMMMMRRRSKLEVVCGGADLGLVLS